MMKINNAQDSNTIINIEHGPIACLKCFPEKSAAGCTKAFADWRVDNNPGYWGSANPEILVLGFSKGANQSSNLPFDKIGFNRARANLREILTALNLLSPETDIDSCFTAEEPRLGFASVIRCGVGRKVGADKWVTSGNVVVPAISHDSPIRLFFENCTQRFLGKLPSSVKLVVFLGIDAAYVKILFAQMKSLYPSLKRDTELVYSTKDIKFIHVIHPSPLATNHRKNWLSDSDGALSGKRREVLTELYKGTDFASPTPLPYNTPQSRKTIKAKTASKKRDMVFSNSSSELVKMLTDAVNKGDFEAQIILNKRSNDTQQIKKLLRLKRSDGQQFAVEPKVVGFWVWSSVMPQKKIGHENTVENYSATETRLRTH